MKRILQRALVSRPMEKPLSPAASPPQPAPSATPQSQQVEPSVGAAGRLAPGWNTGASAHPVRVDASPRQASKWLEVEGALPDLRPRYTSLLTELGLLSSTLTPFSPVRYFTLALARSSASKYQTVIAYLVAYAGCTS